MSAWWILPSALLAGGAVLVWWVAQRADAEAVSLRAELDQWGPLRRDAAGLRRDAGEVRVRFRGLRHR